MMGKSNRGKDMVKVPDRMQLFAATHCSPIAEEEKPAASNDRQAKQRARGAEREIQ